MRLARAGARPYVIRNEHAHRGGWPSIETIPDRFRIRRRSQRIQDQPLVSKVRAGGGDQRLPVDVLPPAGMPNAPDPQTWPHVVKLQLWIAALDHGSFSLVSGRASITTARWRSLAHI